MVVVAVVVVGGAAGIVRMLPIPPLGSRDDWVISWNHRVPMRYPVSGGVLNYIWISGTRLLL